MKIARFILNKKNQKLSINFTTEQQGENQQQSYSFEYLRVFSPTRPKGQQSNGIPAVFHKKNVQLVAIEPLGKYGYRFIFDDQHSAVFSSQYLLELSQHYQQRWQHYLASLTSINNREPAINFKEVL